MKMGKDDAKKAAKAKRQEAAALKAGAVAKKDKGDTTDTVAEEISKAAETLGAVINIASSKAATDSTLAAARNTTGEILHNAYLTAHHESSLYPGKGVSPQMFCRVPDTP